MFRFGEFYIDPYMSELIAKDAHIVASVIANNENTQTTIFRSRPREPLTILREAEARTNPGIHPQGNISSNNSYELTPERARGGRRKGKADMTKATSERKIGKTPYLRSFI
jgi:hypothetical protein